MTIANSLREILLNELGPYAQPIDTAIDEVGLNLKSTNYSPASSFESGKPYFVANFPVNHSEDWFAQLRILKMRDSAGLGSSEIKWQWFQGARAGISQVVRERVYSGLGEAVIFINDMRPHLDSVEGAFQEIGFRKVDLQHPYLRQACYQFAAKDMLFDTPLYQIHRFDPRSIYNGYIQIDELEGEAFDPDIYLEDIKGPRGLNPQNVLKYTGQTQATFQELMDPETFSSIIESMMHTRYISPETIQAKRLLWAASANRALDPGNEKVGMAVKKIRDGVNKKLVGAFERKYGGDLGGYYDSYGNTYIDFPSDRLDQIQMADLACGYAEELFRNYGGEIRRLLGDFKKVFFNGKLVR